MTIARSTIRLAQLAFAAACVVGLVGAWIGLPYHSLWFDELATANIVSAEDLRTMFARNFAETNPPVYYLAVYSFVQFVGMTDTTLRAVSAFFGCVAILIFIVGTRHSFSLPARLFASALATGSYFWFFQSQNARCYTLCLAISAVILSLALSMLRDLSQPVSRGRLAALLLAMTVGGLTHFYLVYQALGVLFILAVFRPRLRLFAGAAGVLIFFSAFAYLRFVSFPYTQIDPNNFWIPKAFSWYPYVLRQVFHQEWRRLGALALGLCLVAIVAGRIMAGRSLMPALRLPGDRVIVLVVAVPLIVLVTAIASSVLIAPSFSDRSFLTCAPFLWALSARLYDIAHEVVAEVGRAFLNAALAVIVLLMSTIVTGRVSEQSSMYLWSAPFRQSAEWIRGVPACRDAIIPVIVLDPKSWYRGDYASRVFDYAYGYYLKGYAQPKIVFIEDVLARAIDPAMSAEMKRRLEGEGCPVVGWAVHGIYEDSIPGLRADLLGALDRSDLKGDRLVAHLFQDGWWGFILAAGGPQK